MKRYVIDTNAIISFITDRNPAQQKAVALVFEQASQLKCSIICPQHVLTETVFVMDRVYGVKKEEINNMLSDFVSMPGVDIRHELDMTMLFSLWPAQIQDFGDAIVATTCKMVKGSSVFTFDRSFTSALKKADIPFQSHL